METSLERASPVQLFGGIDDDTWRWVIREGPRVCPFLARYLPSLPDVTLQKEFVGSFGGEALSIGGGIHHYFKSLFEKHTGPLLPEHRVLDFGCGWGRVIRFFLNDVAPENLHGCDVSDRALAACRETNRWCQFSKNDEFPPTLFDPDTFDFIYAHSVLSHLSEQAHLEWLREFARIAKRDALIVLTTFPRDFLARCAACERGGEEDDPEWQRRAKLWRGRARRQLEAYDRGEFCYSPDFEEAPHFGTACIPEQYVSRVWQKHLDVLDYERHEWQNVIVSRSR